MRSGPHPANVRSRFCWSRIIRATPTLWRERLCGQTGGSFHIEIVWSDTLEGGCRVLSHGGIDLVLLDLSLPDSQGMETFRAIREQAPRFLSSS